MKTITELTQEIKNKFSEKKVIAPVETSSTASQAYAVGKKFFYNNILYKCTTAIAKNGSIVPGTNCTAADAVETQIDSTNTEVNNVKQALSDEVTTRATLGAHNFVEPEVVHLMPVNAEVGSVTTFQENASLTSFIAKVKPNTNYIYSQSSGNRIMIMLSTDYPAAGVACKVIANSVTFPFAFNTESYNYVVFYTNNAITTYDVVKPLLKLASDAYTGFTPYVPTNAELLSADVNAVLGAHNSFNLSLAKIKSINTTGTWSGNSYTKNNVTFAITAEGDTVTNIAVSTTNAGSSAETDLVLDNSFKHESGEYLMNGCPSGGGVNKYGWYLHVPAGYIFDFGTERSVSFDSSVTYDATIRIYNGQIITTAVNFKPMFRLASDPSTKFTPYAKTNRELTENKAEKSDLASINITGTTNTTGATIKSGTYFYLNGTLVEASNDIAANATLTLSTNYKNVTAGALNQMRLKTASIEFEASDFSAQNGGLVAYKNIAANVEHSSLIESVFVSSLEGVYNSCSCGLRIIDSNTMYLVAKTFDTTAAKVKIQIKYRTY